MLSIPCSPTSVPPWAGHSARCRGTVSVGCMATGAVAGGWAGPCTSGSSADVEGQVLGHAGRNLPWPGVYEGTEYCGDILGQWPRATRGGP